MQAQVVAAAAGARWFFQGVRLFLAAPVGWVALVMAYLLAMLIASAIPLAGMAAVALATPAFSVSFMAAARSASTARSVHLGQLAEGFRQQPRTQFVLGAVYFACLVVALAAGGLLAAPAEAPAGGDGTDAEAAAAPSASSFLLFLAFYLPTAMAFWFAPVLAAWHSVGAGKALFFSFFACLMNWRAFLAYGATVAGVVFVLAAAAVLVGRLAAPQVEAAKLALPMLVVVYPTMLASYYASYRDVFASPPADAPASTPTPPPASPS